MNFLKGIYMANDKKPSPENEKIMNQYSIYSLHLIIILFVLYGSCAIALVLSQFVIFALFNENEPVLPILLPFIDYDTKSGASITTSYHYGIIFIGLFGLGYCDSLFGNFIIGVLTMSKLIASDLIFIGKQLKMPSNPCDMRHIRSQLRNTYNMYSQLQRSDLLCIYNCSDFYYIFVFHF